MANYNTFVVVKCNKSIVELVTSSAYKAARKLSKGYRLEVWNENQRVSTIYAHQAHKLERYLETEREYRSYKQTKAEFYNAKRRIMRTCG